MKRIVLVLACIACLYSCQKDQPSVKPLYTVEEVRESLAGDGGIWDIYKRYSQTTFDFTDLYSVYTKDSVFVYEKSKLENTEDLLISRYAYEITITDKVYLPSIYEDPAAAKPVILYKMTLHDNRSDYSEMLFYVGEILPVDIFYIPPGIDTEYYWVSKRFL